MINRLNYKSVHLIELTADIDVQSNQNRYKEQF